MEQEINGKVQKINDEDYEIIKIIEKETYPGSIKWYQELYGCNLEEAVKAIDTIRKNYGVDHVGLYDNLNIEELVLMSDILVYAINSSVIQDKNWRGPVDWIMKKTGWSEDDAYKLWTEASQEWEKRHRNPEQSSKGCIITILIAIMSTLSIGSLMVYFS